MPKQALYLKFRPLSFDDMVGQEHITRTLRNSLKTGRIRHAYLFSGPRGTGKTTSARLLAKAINCQNPDPDKRPCNECAACIAVNEGRYLDLIEIDAATHTGVDDVRDLRDKIAFSPGEGQYKVYIIDEVHRFTGNAFDALLKTLEEPPEHAIFILATTEIDKVPQTIKSRCLPFEFRLYSVTEVADRLQVIAENEGLHINRDALELVARQGTGSMRDSISLLDQIVSDPDEVITLDIVERILGTASLGAVKDVVAALIDEDAARGLHDIAHAVDSGSDPKQFGEQVVEHLRAILLTQTASADLVEASSEDRALYEDQAVLIGRGRLLAAIKAFNDAVNNYRGGWQPQLGLELALLESLKQQEVTVDMSTNYGQAGYAPPLQSAQQAAPPPVETMPPGAPPVIDPAVVREKWNISLKALYRYSKSGPDLMQHFRVVRVDGNTLFLGTDNALYYEKLQYPEKIQVLERVFYEVHRVRLHVRLTMVGSNEMQDTPVEAQGFDPNDPLLSEGAQLGAKITPVDNTKRRSDKTSE
ncbi:MAG: DNA polymerase III subunit gamma/tau [Anaerolineaceae bacterium]|nr:DNA polymerase III subunit gamma/tau [Anaerolineaceae bacterium]